MNPQENPIVRTHITFVEAPPNPKTRVWRVHPRNAVGHDTSDIGSVQWYGRWRKYAFFPNFLTVFEEVCLREIASFCEEATRAHKAQRRQSSSAFTLLELLCVISVIAILLAISVPSVARAYRATAARAAWIEYWESTRKVMIAEFSDRVPPALERFWFQTWSEAYRGIYGTQGWNQVSMDQVREWRTYARAAAGVYDRPTTNTAP